MDYSEFSVKSGARGQHGQIFYSGISSSSTFHHVSPLLCSGILCTARDVPAPLEDGVEQYYYKRFHTAAMFFEEACAKDPMNWEAALLFGRAPLEQLKEYEAAKAEFEYLLPP